MCEMSATSGMPPSGYAAIAGASGGGPSGKPGQSDVGGANGAAPTKPKKSAVAGADGGGPIAGSDAGAGAAALGGGGDLASALSSLATAIKALAAAVSKMGTSGGGGNVHQGMENCDMDRSAVMGLQGEAATKAQYVAPVARPTVSRSNGEDDPFEQQVLTFINQERAKAGLGEVKYNGTLDTAAEKHAKHMSLAGKMAHSGIGDGDPGERIRAEGFRQAWGENVATGQTSAEQVVREWMNSPTHRKNILDPGFRQMGVGYVTDPNGRSYWAQEFGA